MTLYLNLTVQKRNIKGELNVKYLNINANSNIKQHINLN